MKTATLFSRFSYVRILSIFLILGLCFNIYIVDTASALTNDQQISVNNELWKYKRYISARPDQFKTQESINQFYKKIKIALKSKIDILNGIMESLPKEDNATLPITPTQPTCSGTVPTGAGVIKSMNLTSFGGGGVPTWSFVTNTRGTNTDLGISCAWTCSPGYSRSGNGCAITTNPVITGVVITNPITPTQPTCSGTVPTGAGVIKSTNLTSFGGSIPTWQFTQNTRGTNTDLGISCAWTCSPGYSRSGNGCTITTNPKIIWTNNTLSTNYSEYKKSTGDKIYGYILGGDVNNTWSCLAPPNLPNTCDNVDAYRKLGSIGDGWQLNPATGRLEFNGGLSTVGYPTGLYLGSVRTGQNGTDTNTSIFTISD